MADGGPADLHRPFFLETFREPENCNREDSQNQVPRRGQLRKGYRVVAVESGLANNTLWRATCLGWAANKASIGRVTKQQQINANTHRLDLSPNE